MNDYMPRRPGRPKRSEGEGTSLIDWQEPESNAHVLDWRERAHGFGLMPATGDDTETVILPPERLLDEEDGEAYEGRRRDGAEGDEDEEDDVRPRTQEPAEEEEEKFQAGVSREDLDLVRLYLKTVGQRKLLTAKQEQEIGRRIEDARGEVQAKLSTIPSALNTLLSLAAEVKKGKAPAAELILLPDGGELKEDNVAPVLAAFQRVRNQQKRIADCKQKCEDRRSTATTRSNYIKTMRAANEAIENEMRKLPLRPSLIDQIVLELRDLNREFDELDNVPTAQRTTAR